MLEQFKNKHKGERVFIIGTGPSLEDTPLDKLEDEYTISLNKIDLVYEETTWRPDYYVYYDVSVHNKMPKQVIESVKNSIDEEITSFIAESGKDLFGERENIFYFTPEHEKNTEKRKNAIETNNIENIWSNDISDKIYNFGSTITVCTQIAAYMGFEEIYFVGCDLYDESMDGIVFEDVMNPAEIELDSSSQLGMFLELISKSSSPVKSAINAFYYKLYPSIPNQVKDDENHFSDKYAPDQQYSASEMNQKLREVHKVIKMASNKHSFQVYNATLGGYLEVYPRVNLDEIL